MSRRRFTPPFDLLIEELAPGGLGRGYHEETPVLVRGAPPGAVLRVSPFRRKRGTLHARRVSMVTPPPEAAAPRCAVFGLCGGCTLQELPLEVQRRQREAMALAQLGDLEGVRVLPIEGAPDAYGYRNKVELSYSPRRYLSEADHAAGLPIDGAFLGFHAQGRFDRAVDAERCELVPEGLNEVIAAARRALARSAFAPWDVRDHVGFWRHLLLRQASTGERLVALFTSSPPEERRPEALAELKALNAELEGVTGVAWFTNDKLADVAQGELAAILRGHPWIEERLTRPDGTQARYRLSVASFFQTNTAGAEVLYQRVAALAGQGRRLLDLYCGTGAIGLYLADRFEEVVGVELNPAAVDDARANAALNGAAGVRYICGPVEAQVEALAGGDVVIVDPPRAGLHPKASQWLAALEAPRLVYVACKPASLARDRAILEAGRWRMVEVGAVDLFPQTGHVELVAAFEPRGDG
jgi:23S rRNA (uracil1939-C5)-methyltransferase